MQATKYVVYRIGSNSYNQPRCPIMPIGMYQATGKSAAERRRRAVEAARLEHTVYNNQRLRAKPGSRCSRADIERALEYQALVTA